MKWQEFKGRPVFRTYLSFYGVTLGACVVDYIGGLIDNAVGGNYLGEDVLSALSVALPFLLLLSMIGNLFLGGSILASQELGAGNREKANVYFRRTMLLTLVTSLCLTAAVIFWNGPICRLLCRNASDEVAAHAGQYLIWLCPAAVPYLLIFVLTGFVRLDGAQDLPMKATLVLTVSDIVLDFLLVPVWKIPGLALATTVSYALGLLVFLPYFRRKDRVFSLRRKAEGKVSLSRMLLTGAPVAVNRLGYFINSVLLNTLAFSLASDAGGVIVSVRGQCMNIAMAVIAGAIQAGIPALGKSYGAKDVRGQNEMTRLVLGSALLHAGILALCVFLLRNPILALFGIGAESGAFRGAVFALLCLGAELLLKAVITGAVIIDQVTGKEKRSNLFSLLETVILLIPLELAFRSWFGINGLWAAGLAADALLIGIICFTRGKRPGRKPLERG